MGIVNRLKSRGMGGGLGAKLAGPMGGGMGMANPKQPPIAAPSAPAPQAGDLYNPAVNPRANNQYAGVQPKRKTSAMLGM